MLDVRHIRVGDCVRVLKKVEKPSDPTNQWLSRWFPEMDKMVGMVCRVNEISWWASGRRPDGTEIYSGNGISLTDPHPSSEGVRYPRFYFFPVESIDECSVTASPTVIFDKDGFGIHLTGGYTGSGYRLSHSCGYNLCLKYNPFCCGVMELGNFGIKNDEISRNLLTKALDLSIECRKGVVQATTNGSQSQVSKALEAVGFKLKSSFRNPNSGNIVYEWEHRTFNGEVDVSIVTTSNP